MFTLRRSRARPHPQTQSVAANLPPEVLLIVFKHLQPGSGGPDSSGNRQTLSRALRVCTSWHAFIDLLYYSVHLDLPALIRFHYTVHSNSTLAATVRHLHRAYFEFSLCHR